MKSLAKARLRLAAALHRVREVGRGELVQVKLLVDAVNLGVPNLGVPRKIDGLYWGILSKWMKYYMMV